MVPSVILNNGQLLPVIGMGSSQAKPGEIEIAVKDAIDIGYRHFDAAMIYGNEYEVGAAVRTKIKEGVATRDELFITNKLWNTFHRRDQVVPACRKTLKEMGLRYLDLYLIHFPLAMKDGDTLWPRDKDEQFIESDADYVDTWKGMEECVKLGLVKSIGLSNFNSEQIQRILNVAAIKPTVIQLEVHPYLNQNKMLAFCKEKDIMITAYAPFGRPGSSARTMKKGVPPLLQDVKLKEIAEKYGKTIAQVILRYLIQHNTVPIPKSSNMKHLRENLEIFDFELTHQDMTSINSLNTDNRIFTYPDFVKFKHYPFNIEY